MERNYLLGFHNVFTMKKIKFVHNKVLSPHLKSDQPMNNIKHFSYYVANFKIPVAASVYDVLGVGKAKHETAALPNSA